MRKSCLIIDDSQIVRMVARKILESLDFEVTEAENGDVALELAAERPPHVVLLDSEMPGKSGLEFLMELRARDDLPQPLVIFCTTDNDALDIEAAINGGADEYMVKPYDRGIVQGKFREAGLL